MKQVKLNKADIEKILPHRDPFLLIDSVEVIDDALTIGYKNVSADEYYFKGHFPGQPVMPGVLILESLAQVGAVNLLSKPDYVGKIAYFAGIKDAKFRRSVFPGDLLRLECTLTKLRKSFGVGLAKAYVGDQLVCEAEFSFAVS